MTDRGPMGQRPQQELIETAATDRDATYLRTDEEDEDTVHDLGFIVDDRDDRRALTAGNWQRLDDLDSDEPLETNRSGPIPHRAALRERGVPADAFATDFDVQNAAAETQEDDFVGTSMLDSDPDADAGTTDFTDETLLSADGEPLETGLAGEVAGAAPGLGTSLPQDLGAGGFQIRDQSDR